MLRITQEFLDECKGALEFLPLYGPDSGMFVDMSPDNYRVNYWITAGLGRSRPAALVNEERAPIPRATCEALLRATVAQDGGLVLPDGTIADLDESEGPDRPALSLVPRS